MICFIERSTTVLLPAVPALLPASRNSPADVLVDRGLGRVEHGDLHRQLLHVVPHLADALHEEAKVSGWHRRRFLTREADNATTSATGAGAVRAAKIGHGATLAWHEHRRRALGHPSTSMELVAQVLHGGVELLDAFGKRVDAPAASTTTTKLLMERSPRWRRPDGVRLPRR